MSPSTRSARTTGPGGSRVRLVLPALLLGLVWACGPPRERFAHTYASPEAVTEEFLRAVETGDRARLERLALTEQEYRLEVFPEMRAYGNIPPEFAWDQLEGRNLYGASLVLDRFRGRPWNLESIEYHGETTAYQTFRVHREPLLRLIDRETGERSEEVLFGSFLEADGRFKLLSLNLDR